jgi:hypothetical protein
MVAPTTATTYHPASHAAPSRPAAGLPRRRSTTQETAMRTTPSGSRIGNAGTTN